MLISGRNREQEKRQQSIMMSRIAARYERSIAREIARAMNDAARKLGQPMGEVAVQFKHAENMTKILTRLWTQSGEVAITSMFTIAKQWQEFEMKRDISTPIMDEAISSWIRAYGGLKITEITNTTMKDINKIVADGIEEGLSEREIGRLINAVAPSKSASRSQTIARTEVHSSSQGMSLDVASATDIEMVKVWLTNVSDRTREEHIDADGQKRAISQSFDVGGEQLDYPGDPSGSAENTISCRCVVGYELA